MKNRSITKTIKLFFSAVAVASALVACKKDSDGSPDVKAGTPAFSAITPVESAGGTVVTLTGSGLGRMRSIVFDKNDVPATFQPNLNTESSLVFRVPDTAFGGSQNIVFTNVDGKELKVPFKVIALPTVTAASTTDFDQGINITLTGNNLDDVSNVVIEGTTEQATIVSQARKEMTITMPASAVNRGKLRLTNSSGERVTDLEFTNMAKAFKVFTEGWDNGMQDWSWASEHAASSNFPFMGTKSLRVLYGNGAWGAVSIHKDDPKLNVSDYTYLTFWAKGGTADVNVDVYSENGGSKKTINVPANVWTYFKMPIQGHMNGVMLERLDFQARGPNGGDQVIYFDNIMFVK
jgi:hypothetical protein